MLHLPDGRTRADADPLDGRPDSAVRRRDAGPGAARQAPRVQASARVVHRQPAGPDVQLRRMRTPGRRRRRLLAILDQREAPSRDGVLARREEFLSAYGIRSLSRSTRTSRSRSTIDGREHRVDYEPAESSSGLFGGNSNWRGPIWFPVNYLLIESLQKFHFYWGDDVKVELPTGSGAVRLSRRRRGRIFAAPGAHLPAGRGRAQAGLRSPREDPARPSLQGPHSVSRVLHGDDGSGVGASHQTGWTGLVAKLIQQSGG